MNGISMTLEHPMIETKPEARIDVRRAVAGGLLAWIIQALVMFLFRNP
jgi:hypothetical protein